MVVAACLGPAAVSSGQQPDVHYLHQGVMPPGAIGSRQLQRGGPLPGYFQPVEIKAPPGALVSLAVQGTFEPSTAVPQTVGMLIGSVYRMKVTNIPHAEGMEVFPTIEVIDRLYPPLGQELKFPIPVQLTLEDLRLALEGKFVTRIVYVENPRNALPVQEDPREHNWFETGPGRDPLAVADALGRPVAILRMGGRVPTDPQAMTTQFLFGSPPFLRFAPQAKAAALMVQQPAEPGQRTR
jgi:hypothetical protein